MITIMLGNQRRTTPQLSLGVDHTVSNSPAQDSSPLEHCIRVPYCFTHIIPVGHALHEAAPFPPSPLPLSITPYIPCHFMTELVELHRARLAYGMLLAKNKKGQKKKLFPFFYNAIVTNQNG